MTLSNDKKRDLKRLLSILLYGIILGPFYAVFSDGFGELYPFVNAAIGGVLLALSIWIFEFHLFAGGARKWKFMPLLITKLLAYIIVFNIILLNVIVLSRIFRFEQSYMEVFADSDFQNYILKEDFPILIAYTLTLAFVYNFVSLIGRKLGQGQLINFITGAYYKPVIQERIVVFLNMANSGDFAKKLDSHHLHQFLNDFYFDITQPILNHRGVIYEYFEDLVIVTWKMKSGLNHANCIRAIFDIDDKLQSKRSKYLVKYGLSPIIQAGLHGGRMIRAEIGEVKTEIVFHGDVMNTCARILESCKKQNSNILISAPLEDRLNLPKEFHINSVGSIELKGKEIPLELFYVSKISVSKSLVA